MHRCIVVPSSVSPMEVLYTMRMAVRRKDSDPNTNHHDPCTYDGWMDEWMDEGYGMEVWYGRHDILVMNKESWRATATAISE